MKDADLLNYIRQNTEMGIDGIQVVLKNCDDSELTEVLEKQAEEYRQIYEEADKLLHENHAEAKDLNPAAKAATKMTSLMKQITPQSSSKIAEDMIKGSTMGVTKIIKHMDDYSGDNVEIQKLAGKLRDTEESNIEQMKRFL